MSKIEGCFLATVWLLTVGGCAHNVGVVKPLPPIGYLPVVHRYVGGEYAGSVTLEPQQQFRKCTSEVETMVGASAEDPSAPAGSSTRGGCVPIPPPVVAR